MLQVKSLSQKCVVFFYYDSVMIDLTCSLVYNLVFTQIKAQRKNDYTRQIENKKLPFIQM